jgi:putative transposase
VKTNNVVPLVSKEPSEPARSVLEELVRQGARQMLQTALEAEVAEFVAQFTNVVDTQGRRVVVRNGHLPERDLVTGVGPITVKQPRVRDRTGQHKFTSDILPPFLRRVPSIDALIPVLYLKGVSTGDFSEALSAILGPNAAGLSASNIVRLKEGWEQEYEAWSKRDLRGKRYVYLWADGVYFNVRLEEDRPCILVIMGATEDGTKELMAVWDGERESKASWQTVLRDLKRRGLTYTPKLATGDGALGFWAALDEEFPGTQQQRCWVHKTANILDKMPKRVQPDAKKLIHEMYMVPTLADAMKAFDEFKTRYHAKYPKAVDCLTKDEATLFTFYSFPAEHWIHLRTTNPIESTFATVRHRTRQTKGSGSRMATIMMVFKLGTAAQKKWRKLNGHQQLAKVIEGIKFVDGEIAAIAA